MKDKKNQVVKPKYICAQEGVKIGELLAVVVVGVDQMSREIVLKVAKKVAL